MFPSMKLVAIYTFCHFNGARSTELTLKQHLEIWEMCDGYGKMSLNELVEKELTWDWSHVRDSSDATLEAVFNKLKEWNKI